MGSFWANHLSISLFGESHGAGIGATIDKLPPAQAISYDEIQAFMHRRAPGHFPWATKRKESDIPEILSGYYLSRTTGTPMTALVRNTDQRSKDYSNLWNHPRPGHADFSGNVRYRGANDKRGGGHFSGRITAGICFAGSVCLQILRRQGIEIYAHIHSIADIPDAEVDLAHPPVNALRAVQTKDFPVLDDEQGAAMIEAVSQARDAKDSVGGYIECFVLGLPVGIGDPMFGGLEPRLASFIYAIPAVKSLSFGDAPAIFSRRGSQNNDSPQFDKNGKIVWLSNHNGGADGGISNGQPLVFRTGFKPASSVSQPQETINYSSRSNETVTVEGRHDPCIVPRAVPVVEAAAAIVILDALLASGRFDPEKTGEIPEDSLD